MTLRGERLRYLPQRFALPVQLAHQWRLKCYVASIELIDAAE